MSDLTTAQKHYRKDCVGNILAIGDKIVYQGGSRNGGYLVKALVIDFTPKMVKVGKRGGYRDCATVNAYKCVVYKEPKA